MSHSLAQRRKQPGNITANNMIVDQFGLRTSINSPKTFPMAASLPSRPNNNNGRLNMNDTAGAGMSVNNDLIELSTEIISAYVSHNTVNPGDLPKLIADVHGALRALSNN